MDIDYIGFFVLKSIYGGNTARVPCRPDPRTGVRFFACILLAGPSARSIDKALPRVLLSCMRVLSAGAGGVFLKKYSQKRVKSLLRRIIHI